MTPDSTIRRIHKLAKSGLTNRAIVEQTGVHPSTVCRIAAEARKAAGIRDSGKEGTWPVLSPEQLAAEKARVLVERKKSRNAPLPWHLHDRSAMHGEPFDDAIRPDPDMYGEGGV